MAGMVPSTPADGNVKVVVATTVADPYAPTATELNGGTVVDISCYLKPDGFNFTMDQATISDERLCSTATFAKPGRKSYTLALTGIDNTNSDYAESYNKFVESLPEGASRYIYYRGGLPFDEAFAESQTVRVIPVDAGAKTEIPPEANSVLAATINMFVTGDSKLVKVAA